MSHRTLTGFVVVLVTSMLFPSFSRAADTPKIGVSGDKFTIDGQPKFLLGVSYYDVLGWKTSDLDALQTRKFNLVRVWLDWKAGENPSRSCFDTAGNLDPARGQTVLDFVRACAARGIVVDATNPAAVNSLPDLNARKNAVRNAVALLKNEPNVIFDIINEHEPFHHDLLQQLIDVARLEAPSGIFFASNYEELITDITVTSTNQTNINEEVNTLKFSALAPHFKRDALWYGKTDQRIGAMKDYLNLISKVLPLYLQEEARRRHSGLNPTKDQFLQAARECRDAGGAGWIFHTDAGFDLTGTKTFFGNLDPDASGVEKATVDALGNEIFGSGGSLLDVSPEADAYVYQNFPSTNYGTSTELRVGGPAYRRDTFLRFNVTGLPGGATVTDAKLLLTTLASGSGGDAGQSGGAIRRFAPTDPLWIETAVTWNAYPAGSDASGDLATLGPVTFDTQYMLGNLQSAVTANGRYTFVIRSPYEDGAGYCSKEHGTVSKRPVLRITYTSGGAPTVAITSPVNNATFVAPANITINAMASDSDGTVAKVEFFQGAALLGTDTMAPYSFTWNDVASGSYTLTAKVTDNSGAMTTSAPVKILVTRTAPGPLRVHPTNPRYFDDGTGKAVVLTGSHTWTNLQDRGPVDPPAPLDYALYLNFMSSHNHNFMRLWAWENSATFNGAGSVTQYRSPMPYTRTGPGTALDGKAKFDLTQFNQAYFDRLRARVVAARDRGIYVAVMLFQGFSVDGKGISDYYPWKGHPFHRANNINGVDGDPSGNEQGEETYTMSVDPKIVAVRAYQEAYVRKVIDTVNDLDNVVYDISNESNGTSASWQNYLVDFIRAYEGGKPRQHLVGITAMWPNGTNAQLFSSRADWISPLGNDGYGHPAINPPAATGAKVILNDTDHSYFGTTLRSAGQAVQRAMVWKNFTRGIPVLFMDPYLEWIANRNFPTGATPDAYWDMLRDNLGVTLRYADRMNLVAMTPQNGLSSTAYCLAKVGAEYLVYQPGSGAFTVNLAAGTYTYEWFNPTAVAVVGTGTRGGGSQSFTPPFSGDAVLYLKVAESTIPPTITTQPASQAVMEGQAATFSVVASGSAPLNYQWRKDGISISGATTSTYTTPATKLTDSGSNFSVVVSNSAGSMTSENATLTVAVSSGPVAWWRLDGEATDASGNGNHGTLVGNPKWVAGRVSAALNFDGGLDDYMSCGAGAGLNVGVGMAFTIAGWVKTTDSYGPIYSARNNMNGGAVIDLVVGFDGAVVSAGRVMALVRQDGGTGGFARVTGGTVNNGLWHHVAVVRSGTTITLYLDGSSQGAASGTQSGGAITTNMRALGLEREWARVGFGTSDQRYLNGSVDDVRIYNRALTLSEIQVLASMGGGNVPPVADAGADQVVDPGSVALDASASSDPDNGPQILTYTWSQVSGPMTATINNANAPLAQAALATIGDYVFRLTVSDGQDSSTDTVAIAVLDSTPPTVDTTHLVLKGTTDGTGSSIVSVTVNGQAANRVGNTWSKEVPVSTGLNTFTIEASDEGGQAATQTVGVTK